MEAILKQASRFSTLVDELKKSGIRKREIADYLELPAPVFSSLNKTVLPKIIQINPDAPDDEQKVLIKQAFELANNLSQVKIISKLAAYVEKLEKYEDLKNAHHDKSSYFSMVKKHADHSYDTIKKYYEGIYDLYYVSSDKNCIKKDPFMIRCNHKDRVAEAYKGNNNTTVKYNGIAVINNSHALSLQLTETNEDPVEYLMIHLSLPFIRKAAYLRGIFSCLNFARQPIARKVVLVKTHDEALWGEYEKIHPHFYTEPKEFEYAEIAHYLLDGDSKIECKAIPNPSFSFDDLEKELRM